MIRRFEPVPVLGALERAVLDYLWAHGDADVISVHKAIGIKREISVNTVGSALERLYRKRLVARRKRSHAFQYRADVGRNAFLARQVVQSVGGIGVLKSPGFLASFVDLATNADEANLDALAALIAEKRGARKR
jgi:predicted transcriptional regulator